jgi:phage gp29-like protein
MGRNPKSFGEAGVASGYDANFGIRYLDTLVELRGISGLRNLRIMSDNDPTVGAILMGITMLTRGARWSFEPADASPAAAEAAEFMQSVMDGMDLTFEDFLDDAMTMLVYGFSLFEIVMKRRADGRIVVKKLGPRPQWTIDRFDVDETGSVMLGAWQNSLYRGMVYMPADRLLHMKVKSAYADPAGKSILRNAYRSYRYVTNIQEYEAVAIERELNGLPVGRIPSDYLSPNATDSQKAFVDKFKQILGNVKRNEQGYLLIPSDPYEDSDGKISSQRMVEFELLASQGTRDIDTNKSIIRHQQDIARSVLADFLMLGSNDRGSFAMSKSKTDIFVKSMRSILNSVAAPINRQLIPKIWEANSFDPALMPKIQYENLAPVDLDVLGGFIRSLALANANIFPDLGIENALLNAAGLPPKVATTAADDEIIGEDE